MSHSPTTLAIPGTNQTATQKSGYSWTTLFFGPLPALFRGDLAGALIGLLIGILTLGLGWLIWAGVYNDSHAKRLAEKGYRPVRSPSPRARVSATGAWAPDPFARFEVRYFDGRRWTAKVAVGGSERTDPPKHAAPAGDGASWAPDPFGRFKLRYFDGRRWTGSVSSGDGTTLTDRPGYPPPAQAGSPQPTE